MTMTAIAIETTETTETTHDEQTGDARDNQRPADDPQSFPETGTAYLPGATPGASAINWK